MVQVAEFTRIEKKNRIPSAVTSGDSADWWSRARLLRIEKLWLFQACGLVSTGVKIKSAMGTLTQQQQQQQEESRCSEELKPWEVMAAVVPKSPEGPQGAPSRGSV